MEVAWGSDECSTSRLAYRSCRPKPPASFGWRSLTRGAPLVGGRATTGLSPAATIDPFANCLPPRSRMVDNSIPFAPDLIVGWAIAAADAIKFLLNLASDGGGCSYDEHHPEQRGDH